MTFILASNAGMCKQVQKRVSILYWRILCSLTVYLTNKINALSLPWFILFYLISQALRASKLNVSALVI